MSQIKYSKLLSRIKEVGVDKDLSKVFRWGDQLHDQYPKESTWEHTVSTVLRVEYYFKQYELSSFLDLDKCKLLVLIHDIPEAYAKHKDIDHADPERERKKAENDEVGVFKNIVLDKLGYGDKLFKAYLEIEELVSNEGVFAKMIERYDGYIKHWSYLHVSNLGKLDEYEYCWNRTIKIVEKVFQNFKKNQNHKAKLKKACDDVFFNMFHPAIRYDFRRKANTFEKIRKYHIQELTKFIK